MQKIKLGLILMIFLMFSACTKQATTLNQDVDVITDNDLPAVINDSKSPEEIDLSNNIFYFAYGSNMNLDRMNDRCGQDNFTDLGQGILAGYDFYFYQRGYANIKEKASQEVEGVLFKINSQCLRDLDQVEGYPNIYQRRVVKVSFDQKMILAQVYLVENDQSTAKPSDEYYQVVLSGAESHGLSEHYVNKIKSLK